ncbi:DinB family protein [Fulvivirgaceae bacterium BMA12]|uniref:DinB family protein n=1 Tax=Agaribacillus aureus TaxID=3051825 RepID=A0ABT8L170_9BACT|nr:DinB family protein [Fulvivirgaceae bacterium BMA12]
MDKDLKEILWKQFGASIDMLENAITLCPNEMWDTDTKFWYNAYHCLFYLDYYLTLEPDTFSPPSPFTLSEFDPSGAMPDRTYSKEELISYLQANRNKCRVLISTLTQEILNKRWADGYRNYSMLEMLLYNMRHVQHHAAQLNLLLRQGINDAPKWVSQTKIDL